MRDLHRQSKGSFMCSSAKLFRKAFLELFYSCPPLSLLLIDFGGKISKWLLWPLKQSSLETWAPFWHGSSQICWLRGSAFLFKCFFCYLWSERDVNLSSYSSSMETRNSGHLCSPTNTLWTKEGGERRNRRNKNFTDHNEMSYFQGAIKCACLGDSVVMPDQGGLTSASENRLPGFKICKDSQIWVRPLPSWPVFVNWM